MRDAFPIVCALGDRLQRERRWAEAKALIVLVAEAGDWNGAVALADALGINTDAQEAIYHEVLTKAVERNGRHHQESEQHVYLRRHGKYGPRRATA